MAFLSWRVWLNVTFPCMFILLETADELKLGGERRLLTALFADIRGFASIEFFTAMTETVLSYEGTVDKYMGDSILAFYGAPLEQPDHALRACKTAVEMLTRLKKLRLAWKVRDLPPINIGIGINSGEMIVGNMGSAQHFDYTIMGDHVNLASRLQGVNKPSVGYCQEKS